MGKFELLTNKEIKMNRIFVALLLSVMLLFSITLTAQKAKPSVVLFSPGTESNEFWGQVIGLAKAASNDLNIDLVVYYGNDDGDRMVEQMTTAATLSPKPAGYLFPSMKSHGKQFLEVAESAQIPSIVFNMGIESDVASAPRVEFKYWIGQIVPDDNQTGFLLGTELLKAADERNLVGSNNKINVLAISGRDQDHISHQRVEGLKRAIATHRRAELVEISYSDWTRENARDLTSKAFKKNSDIQVVWTASDLMSAGATDALTMMGKKMGDDFIIGGIDWTMDGLKRVEDKQFIATVGGHFMEGGWAVIMMSDYLRGKDFITESASMNSPMMAITNENVLEYRKKLNSGSWDTINFAIYSKVMNPRMKTYKFSIPALMVQMRAN